METVMKIFALSLATISLVALNACTDVSVDSNSPEAVAAKAERIEAKTTTDLSKMDVPEIIDFVDAEATQMTALLKTVTDGPSAEAAVEEIRNVIPRLNASIKSLETMDPENMTLSIGNMRRMMKVAQSQTGLFQEITRIGQIPEARAVLEKEFDKIEITNR
jgi:hypothetical protein